MKHERESSHDFNSRVASSGQAYRRLKLAGDQPLRWLAEQKSQKEKEKWEIDMRKKHSSWKTSKGQSLLLPNRRTSSSSPENMEDDCGDRRNRTKMRSEKREEEKGRKE